MRSEFSICNAFWKEISVSLVSSWSLIGVLLCTATLIAVAVVAVAVLRLI